MNNKDFLFLSRFSNILTREFNISDLDLNLKKEFSEFIKFEKLDLYVFDEVTNTLRNCGNNWSIINDNDEVYEAFENLKEYDFIINKKAYKIPNQIGDIAIKINSLIIPLIKGENIFGLIKLEFNNEETLNTYFLQIMKIFATEISLKIQNVKF